MCFCPDAANAEKGTFAVSPGFTYRVLAGKGLKNPEKKRALVPSDEGRVRKSTAVQTMFVFGDAFTARRNMILQLEMERKLLWCAACFGFFFKGGGSYN